MVAMLFTTAQYNKIFDTITGFELLLKPNTRFDAANMKKIEPGSTFYCLFVIKSCLNSNEHCIAISRDIF